MKGKFIFTLSSVIFLFQIISCTPESSNSSKNGTYKVSEYNDSSNFFYINFSSKKLTMKNSDSGTISETTFTYNPSKGLLTAELGSESYTAYIKKHTSGKTLFMSYPPYTLKEGHGLIGATFEQKRENHTSTLKFNSDGTFTSSDYKLATCTWQNNKGIIKASLQYSPSDNIFTTYYVYDGTNLYNLYGTLTPYNETLKW